jgi:nitroimidazol reductase NimA-like FMN-containing flavoprotein (pyridoxamine 5'-phosphate oxidase superfamily)
MSKAPSLRTTVKRVPDRAEYDRGAIHEILDSALICHVGFVQESQPYVIPTIHVRRDESLYVHGATGSRMLKVLDRGGPICVTVTLLDGLVLARSAFHHSMNYRSAVVLGSARVVDDEQEKLDAMRALVEHASPGRWQDIRHPNKGEFARTKVLALSLEESSAKVRTGPPVDEEDDYALEVWAGVIPVEQKFGKPIDDPRLQGGANPPCVR